MPSARTCSVSCRSIKVAKSPCARKCFPAAATLALAYILLPLGFVVWLSFYAQEIPSYPPVGDIFDWYRVILGNERFINGLVLSAQLEVIATGIGLAVAVPAALALSHFRFPGRGTMSNLPLMVPGVVLCIAIYVFHVEIAILHYLQWNIDPTIAAISVVQIVPIAVAMLVTDRFVRLSRVV